MAKLSRPTCPLFNSFWDFPLLTLRPWRRPLHYGKQFLLHVADSNMRAHRLCVLLCMDEAVENGKLLLKCVSDWSWCWKRRVFMTRKMRWKHARAMITSQFIHQTKTMGRAVWCRMSDVNFWLHFHEKYGRYSKHERWWHGFFSFAVFRLDFWIQRMKKLNFNKNWSANGTWRGQKVCAVTEFLFWFHHNHDKASTNFVFHRVLLENLWGRNLADFPLLSELCLAL